MLSLLEENPFIVDKIIPHIHSLYVTNIIENCVKINQKHTLISL
jgi:hypothetical protein